MEDSSLSYPTFLPTNSSNHHNRGVGGSWGGQVSIHRDTPVIKSKICPCPCLPSSHCLAISGAQGCGYGNGYLWENRLKEESGICYRPFGEDVLGLRADLRADTPPWLHGRPHYVERGLPRGRPEWDPGHWTELPSSKGDTAHMTNLSLLLGHSGVTVLPLGRTSLSQLSKTARLPNRMLFANL